MHQPIRERLEDYLSGMGDPGKLRAVEDHMASCRRCREAMQELRRHSRFLKALRPPDDLEPVPGFYARVMDRIESQRTASFWSAFLEPAFARRLAYASLTLLILLGTLMITGRSTDTPAPANQPYVPEAILAEEPVAPYIGDDLEHDREVVLVNLATYQY